MVVDLLLDKNSIKMIQDRSNASRNKKKKSKQNGFYFLFFVVLFRATLFLGPRSQSNMRRNESEKKFISWLTRQFRACWRNFIHSSYVVVWKYQKC